MIDYQSQNPLNGGERYDVILDVASNPWFDVCAPALTPIGSYVPIGHAHFGKANIVGSLPVFVALLLRALLNPEKRRTSRC